MIWLTYPKTNSGFQTVTWNFYLYKLKTKNNSRYVCGIRKDRGPLVRPWNAKARFTFGRFRMTEIIKLKGDVEYMKIKAWTNDNSPRFFHFMLLYQMLWFW